MKLGVVLYSNDPETVYQAFRLGIYALGQGDSVNMFLLAKGVEIRGDETVCASIPQAVPAAPEDWGQEYLDLILAVRVVKDIDEAIAHITRYGTSHSEAIVADDTGAAGQFLAQVDAAAVYHNASTRFTDGGEFGFGAEIGISTQKLHARGPVGLEQLTTFRYLIHGEGQVRT